jgi:Na+/citrate or Na+/malate symporter
VEASLAYMRDLLALDREALTQSLASTGIIAEAEFRWIPSLGQMIMGFILPFALAFVAIPLESFIHSLRTVIGMIALAMIRTLAILARTVGNAARQLSQMLVSLYDIVIMLPLGIERLVSKGVNRKQSRDNDIEYIMEEPS